MIIPQGKVTSNKNTLEPGLYKVQARCSIETAKAGFYNVQNTRKLMQNTLAE